MKNGLNIILGGNKTGKSSIIKSIFTTLGCECKRIETDWKKLISAYLLFFKYGEKLFCVVRQGKKISDFLRIMRIPILALSKRKLFTNIVTV